MTLPDFEPGDLIVHTSPAGKRRRWRVDDPARTVAGKLRLISSRGAKLTAWWRFEERGIGGLQAGVWHVERTLNADPHIVDIVLLHERG